MGTLGFYTNPDFPADSAAAVAAAIQAAQDAQAAAEEAITAAAAAGGLSWSVLAASATTASPTKGQGIFTDTTTQAQTIILPASPTLGDRIGISDGGNSWDTNTCTVDRNGQYIMGLAQNMVLDVQYQTIVLVYSDSSKGWRIT